MVLRLIPLLIILILKREISIRKIYAFLMNFLKGYILGRDLLYAYPSIVMLEPTNRCNLRCKECGFQLEGGRSASVPRENMPLESYRKIIDEMKDQCLFLFLYMGGESFLHEKIFEMIKYASINRIFTIIATNGSFSHITDFGRKVRESGLDVLIFSISGTTQLYYEKFHRRGNLEKVIENISSLVKNKKMVTPRIILRYLATPENKNDWMNFKPFAKSLGVDSYEIRHIDGELILSENFTEEAPQVKPEAIFKRRNCFWLWSTMVIRASGEVIPCCFDYYGVPVLGRVDKDSTVGEVWQGPRYRNFRRAWIRNRKLECCAHCESRIGFQDNASKGKAKIFVKRPKRPVKTEEVLQS